VVTDLDVDVGARELRLRELEYTLWELQLRCVSSPPMRDTCAWLTTPMTTTAAHRHHHGWL
jgi:hypothetical protein